LKQQSGNVYNYAIYGVLDKTEFIRQVNRKDIFNAQGSGGSEFDASSRGSRFTNGGEKPVRGGS
jgi:hypothetical protein